MWLVLVIGLKARLGLISLVKALAPPDGLASIRMSVKLAGSTVICISTKNRMMAPATEPLICPVFTAFETLAQLQARSTRLAAHTLVVLLMVCPMLLPCTISGSSPENPPG